MCHVGVSSEGSSVSTMIGLSSHCKLVFNEESITPRCAVVHFEVKLRYFSAKIKDVCKRVSNEASLTPLCHAVSILR